MSNEESVAAVPMGDPSATRESGEFRKHHMRGLVGPLPRWQGRWAESVNNWNPWHSQCVCTGKAAPHWPMWGCPEFPLSDGAPRVAATSSITEAPAREPSSAYRDTLIDFRGPCILEKPIPAKVDDDCGCFDYEFVNGEPVEVRR